MNKSDLIADARNQLTLAKRNLAAGKDAAAIENLRETTLQIARFNGVLRAEQAKCAKPAS